MYQSKLQQQFSATNRHGSTILLKKKKTIRTSDKTPVVLIYHVVKRDKRFPRSRRGL